MAAVLMMGSRCGPQDEIPSRNPGPCSTYFDAERNEWMEEDGEPIDDDPCDREPDSKPSTVKPAAKPTPKKTSAPIGGVKKKF